MPSSAMLFGVALAAGSVPLALRARRRLREYRLQANWPKVEAKVLESSVAENTDGDRTSYRLRLVFSYSISGPEYSSGQHTDGGEFPRTRQSVEQIVRRFPAGTTTYVAVNPTKPLDAVLDTEFPKIWQLLHHVGTVGAVVGIAIFVYQAASTQ